MKAYVIEEFGGIEAIHETDIPKPTPLDHEVLIQLAYTSVNPVDWKISEGYLKERLPHEYPVTLGWDAAGIITEVGKDVEHFQVGDQVFGYARKEIVHDGTFAEFITLDQLAIAHIPDSMSLEEAAAIPLTSLTAWQSLFDVGHLKKNETLLIHGGAGGVGSFAIQFAKYAGAYVITTASKKNHDYVKSLGADEAIDYIEHDFVKALPNGVDIVFDCVGGQTFDRSWDVLKPGGRLISIAAIPDQEEAKKRDVTAAFHFVERSGEQLGAIGTLIAAGIVKLPNLITMPIDQVEEALRLSKEGHTRGKIVLKIK